MRRFLVALVAAGVVVAASYVGTSLNTRPPAEQPTSPLAASTQPAPRLVEVERLIVLFEERTVARTDPLDLRELGRLYIERGNLTGDLADFEEAVGGGDPEIRQTGRCELFTDLVGRLVPVAHEVQCAVYDVKGEFVVRLPLVFRSVGNRCLASAAASMQECTASE